MKKLANNGIVLILLVFEVGCGADFSIKNLSPVSISTSTPNSGYNKDLTNEERLSGKETGETIISAVEKFHKNTGDYPNKLSDLVPLYIEEIPLTKTGQEFQYVSYQPDFVDGPYLLYFYTIEKTWVCAYHPRYEEWECGGYGPPP